jgi:hypothetical protein
MKEQPVFYQRLAVLIDQFESFRARLSRGEALSGDEAQTFRVVVRGLLAANVDSQTNATFEFFRYLQANGYSRALIRELIAEAEPELLPRLGESEADSVPRALRAPQVSQVRWALVLPSRGPEPASGPSTGLPAARRCRPS